MKNKKNLVLVIMIILIALGGFIGVRLTQPAFALTMDVNPSIEIVSSRLDRVVEVNPLNEDAREMLKDFNLNGRNLKNTVEDLADLMVLKGYISGGKDNLVMITVNDDSNQDVVDRLNAAIAAYLENKQIEATIVNQAISKDDDRIGKEAVAAKISELDDELDYDMLTKFSLKQLVEYAEARNIAPETLFSRVLSTKETKRVYTEFIGEAKAKEIALGLVKGEIVKFELDDIYDDDDDNPEYEIDIIANGFKYEIELDAYTGRVLEFERDDDYRDDSKKININNASKADNKPSVEKSTPVSVSTKPAKKQVIGAAKAKEIALGLTKGGKVVEFELDEDDGRLEYEIEIKANGYEYEIELDAYTGKVLDFEKDHDDDYYDDHDDNDDWDDDWDDDDYDD